MRYVKTDAEQEAERLADVSGFFFFPVREKKRE